MLKLRALLLVSLLPLVACNNSKPSITISGSMNNGNFQLCIKGTGYTSGGALKLSMFMPTYTVNGQPGPNPLANAPFGNTTADSGGNFQQTASLSGRGEAVCAGTPSDPVLFLVDQTTVGIGAASLPPGFMCGNLPAPQPFGDPSTCR